MSTQADEVGNIGIDQLIDALRQLARRQRQYGAENTEKIDVTCDLTIGDLDASADFLTTIAITQVQP